MNKYKTAFISLLVVIVLGWAGWVSYTITNTPINQYLYDPTVVLSAETGEPYTRAELLDMMLAAALENTKEE